MVKNLKRVPFPLVLKVGRGVGGLFRRSLAGCLFLWLLTKLCGTRLRVEKVDGHDEDVVFG